MIGDVAAVLAALAVWRLIAWAWPPSDGDEPGEWPDHWW